MRTSINLTILAFAVGLYSPPLLSQTSSDEVGLLRSAPNVLGLTEAAARADLDSAGLIAVISRHGTISVEDIGTIARQMPRGGERVRVGSEVHLSLSVGVYVPSLIGLSAEDARSTLDLLGFNYEFSEELNSAPIGKVVAQNPHVGAMVNISSSTIRITISQGQVRLPSFDFSTDPEVFLPSVESVRSLLSNLGLQTVIQGQCDSSSTIIDPTCESRRHCVVTSIDPPSDAIVGVGTTITLVTESRHQRLDTDGEPCIRAD